MAANDKPIQVILVVAIVAVLGTAGYLSYKILNQNKVAVSNTDTSNTVATLNRHNGADSNAPATTNNATPSTNPDIWLSVIQAPVDAGATDVADLQSFNLSTKQIRTVRTLPPQGGGSYNIIPQPENGKMAYYKLNGNDRQIIWSSTSGGAESVVDQADSTSSDSSWLEALSPDGRYVLYAKGSKEVQTLYDSATKKTEVLSLPKIAADIEIRFSSSGRFLYGLTDAKVGSFFAVWTYDVSSKKTTIVDIKAEDNPNTLSVSPDDSWLAVSTGTSGSPTTAQVELINLQTGTSTGSLVIPNRQLLFHTIVWLSPSQFVVRTNNGQAGTEAVLQNKLFLITVSNGKMASKEFSTDPKNTITAEMVAVGPDQVLLSQFTSDSAGTRSSYSLTGVKIDGTTNKLLTKNDKASFFLLTDLPQPTSP